MEEESTMMRTEQIIEHVVLLSAKEEDDPSRVNQMVNSLNSLPLDQSDLIYLTAGPILRVRSSSPGDEDDEDDLRLSHMVHARSRFQSEPDLAALVHQLVLPISDLVVTVDWVAESLDGPLVPKPGSALRLTLFKLKHQIQGDDGVIPSILEGLCKFKSNPGNNPFHLDQISYGKSINIKISSSSSSSSSEKLWCNLKLAALAVFPDLNELDACEEYEDEMRSLIHNHKIQASLHSLIHLDYVLPRIL